MERLQIAAGHRPPLDHEEVPMRNRRRAIVLLFAALVVLATLTLSGTGSAFAAGSARQVVTGGGDGLCGTPTTPECPLT
jgi:hypothetical protein